MNAYEERVEAKRQRLQERAQRARKESDAAARHARSVSDMIPLGQPILVGHHSEKRHRRDLERIHRGYQKAHELDKKAEYLEDRADALGTGGISSDDPDALEKLRAEHEKRERKQELMLSVNRIIRKHLGKGKDAQRAALIEAGIREDLANELLEPNFLGGVGYPQYALTNNRAAMRRLEQRIQEIEANQSRKSQEEKHDGFTFRKDVDENRVMFEFPGKPDEETRKLLKRNGFKWSPTRGAWVRQWTENAEWAAQDVITVLGGSR